MAAVPAGSLRRNCPFVSLAFFSVAPFSYAAVYPIFDIYRTGSSEDQLALLSTKPSSQYPAFNLCKPLHYI